MEKDRLIRKIADGHPVSRIDELMPWSASAAVQ
jgi:hypothetical protein